jgi:integrase
MVESRKAGGRMPNIYRRGKIWWGCAIRQGRKYRRSLKTADRALAERRLRQWLGELDAMAWGDKPRRTFEETTERFVRDHLTTLKPRGAERYLTSMKQLAAHFDGKTLDQIKSAELSDFETKRRSDGASSSTIRRDLACLSSIFTSVIDWEWIDDGSNPVPPYLRRRAKRGLKEAPGRTRYLSVEEEAKLIAAASPVNMRNKNGRQAGKWTCCREAIIVAIDTGLRRDELFGLCWSQIDLKRGVITTGTRTKSGRPRMVPVSPRMTQS